MLFNPVPDLVDPASLADTNLMSLAQAVGLTAGEVTLTVDPTLVKPVRIRTAGEASYSPTAHRNVEDLILALSDICAPFSVEFLKAKIRPDDSVWPLDLVKLVSTLQLMYLRVQECTGLAGHSVLIDLSVSLKAGPETKPDPSVILGLVGDDGRDPAKHETFNRYIDAVRLLWSQLVRTSLGHWLRENGIFEFRMSGEVVVDPAIAMAAVNYQRPLAPIPNLN